MLRYVGRLDISDVSVRFSTVVRKFGNMSFSTHLRSYFITSLHNMVRVEARRHVYLVRILISNRIQD